MAALLIRCPKHHDNIKDWGSDYRSPYRVVIHWREGSATFALHKVEYDQYGFPSQISRDGITASYRTTAELAQEARCLGLDMDQVSNIFYDRYLEYREFFPDKD